MNSTEILNSIILVSEFMGYKILHKKFQYQNYSSSNESYFAEDQGDIVCDKNGREVNLYPDRDPLCSLSELPFNSDWNWLMDVIIKIEDTTITGYVAPGKPKITLITDKKLVYKQVVEFIEWFNEQQKQQ